MDEDGSRYLLGDHLGNLLLLVLQHDGSHVVGLKTEPLGCISAPSTISYLDNGVVYVGSSFGDSQLVRLLPLRQCSNGSGRQRTPDMLVMRPSHSADSLSPAPHTKLLLLYW